MKLQEYYSTYLESGKIHAANIIKYGSGAFMGYPERLPEQLARVDFIISHASGLILDIGCDSGYILSVCDGGIGVDISRERLKAAKHWNPELPLFQALGEYLPFKNSLFDTVIAAEILEHVLNLDMFLQEVLRVLKHVPGKFIVTVPDEINGKSHKNPEHLRRFSEEELKVTLNKYFNIFIWEYIKGDYPVYCVYGTKK